MRHFQLLISITLVLASDISLSFGQTCVNSTTALSSIRATTAVSGGNVCSLCDFRGLCWSTTTGPVATLATSVGAGSGSGIFSATMTGLSPATIYYVRMYYGSNIVDPINGKIKKVYSYGNEIKFKTAVADPPVLTTSKATNIQTGTAVSGGNITSSVGASVTQRGVCWSLNSLPTIALTTKTNDGTGTGSFVSNITGLQSGSKYFIRSYATNSAGTSYGQQDTIVTSLTLEATTYSAVKIGPLFWLSPDLRVVKYRNGDPIATGLSATDWAATNSGAFDQVGNLTFSTDLSGNTNPFNNNMKVYNFYAVADPRLLCPAGWRVATQADWVSLETALGGVSMAGGKMKNTQTNTSDTSGGFVVSSVNDAGWYTPNTGATNSSGFSASSTAIRNEQGVTSGLYQIGRWWAGDGSSATQGNYRSASYNSAATTSGTADKHNGFGVRCVRN